MLDKIPVGKKHPQRYALIIGNEQYAKSGLGLINVDYARRDARLFRGYALRYWGIPENNIFHLEDATAGIMHAYIERLVLLLKSAPGEAEVYFYFAGHGLDGEPQNTFIPAPVDADPRNASVENSFLAIVEKLSRKGQVRVVAFTDACFSGRGRSGEGQLAVRGVRYRPLPGSLPEGTVHFAAARTDEYAYAWNEKGHGLFTGILFTILQSVPANTTWEEASEQVRKGVMEKAARIHYASQEPVLNGAPNALQHFKHQRVRN